MSALALGLLGGGCGGGGEQVPDDAVAKVGDHVITREAARRAVVGRIAIKHSTRTMPSYLPTDVDACVQERLGGGAQASSEVVRKRCERERDQRERSALRFLIKGEWYRLDAKQRGVPIPPESSAARWASAHAGVGIENLRGVAGIYLLRLATAQRLGSQLSSEGGERQQQLRDRLARYEARLRSKYRDETICADGHRVPECK